MLVALLKATFGIVAIGALWMTVDHAWRRVFGQRDSRCGSCAVCSHRCTERD